MTRQLEDHDRLNQPVGRGKVNGSDREGQYRLLEINYRLNESEELRTLREGEIKDVKRYQVSLK